MTRERHQKSRLENIRVERIVERELQNKTKQKLTNTTIKKLNRKRSADTAQARATKINRKKNKAVGKNAQA